MNSIKYQKKALSTKGLTVDLINKFSILNGAKYFPSGLFQNFLVFTPAKNILNILVALLRLIYENIENLTKSDTNFAATFVDRHVLPNFNGHCLINNNIYIPKKVINLYISYTISRWLRNLITDFILKIVYLDL